MMLIHKGLVGNGDEGKQEIRDRESALMDASIIEGEMACYFKERDFQEVYPQYDQAHIFDQIVSERVTMVILEQRRAKIKEVCEANNWFEGDDGHRLTADEIPET